MGRPISLAMLIYFAVILTVLLGFCGLAVDVGRIELRQLQLQAAVDDAAVATATDWQQGSSNWQATAAAESGAYLSANNLPAASVDNPIVAPTAGPYAADYSTLQVTLHQTVPTIFLGLIEHGSSSVALTVSADARVPPCSYFLASPAVGNGGSNQGFAVQLAGTGVNTSCPLWARTGMGVDGSSQIAGGPSGASGAAGSSQIQGSVAKGVSYLAPRQTDPLAYLQAPVFAHCGHTHASYSGTVTLRPGTWCGGLNASGATLNLEPGLYLITGGANWSNTTINGTGVTLYFTQGGGSGFGTFSLNHHSSMKVSAPVDASQGGLAGVVLFADRAWSGGSDDFQCNNSTFLGDGVFYTPGTGLSDLQCSMSAPNYFSLVTANLYASSTTLAFSANYNTLSGGSPLHNNVSLVQ